MKRGTFSDMFVLNPLRGSVKILVADVVRLIPGSATDLRSSLGGLIPQAPVAHEASTMKTCIRCGLTKALDSFYKTYKGESRRNVCKSCRDKYIYAARKARGDFRQLREEVIREYGGECSCCGEALYEFLAIDHIGNWGHLEGRKGGHPLYKRLKTQGFPKDLYRLLCHNCNQSIGIYGYCPHRPLVNYRPAREVERPR